jgi:hypothetical protein
VGIIVALLVYWLLGDDIRAWLRYGDGKWVLRAALGIGILWAVKRFLVFERVRDIPIASHRLAQVDAGAVLAGLLAVDREYAGAVVPAQLTYSPHHDRHYAATEQDNEAVDGVVLPLAPPAVLPAAPVALLADWRDKKLICQSESSLLLGFDKSIGSVEPSSGIYLRLGEQSDVALLAVSGDSGSGKTSTMRFLMAQAAMQGAAIVLCDPHGRDNAQSLVQSCAPLASSFLMPPAVSWDEIREAIQTVDRIGRNRLSAGAADREHVMLVIDEFSDVARNAPDIKDIARLLVNIADLYRKVNLTAWLVVHHWRVNEWKSGTLKDAVQGTVFHRMAKSEAKLFVSDPTITTQIHYLPHGDAVFFKRGQAQPVRLTGIPEVKRAHLDEAKTLFLPAPRSLPSMLVPSADAQPSAPPSAGPSALLERVYAHAQPSGTVRASVRTDALYEDADARAPERTDGRTTEQAPASAQTGADAAERARAQAQVLGYLRVYVRAGKSREFARSRLRAKGVEFQNSMWTDARRLEGVTE